MDWGSDSGRSAHGPRIVRMRRARLRLRATHERSNLTHFEEISYPSGVSATWSARDSTLHEPTASATRSRRSPRHGLPFPATAGTSRHPAAAGRPQRSRSASPRSSRRPSTRSPACRGGVCPAFGRDRAEPAREGVAIRALAHDWRWTAIVESFRRLPHPPDCAVPLPAEGVRPSLREGIRAGSGLPGRTSARDGCGGMRRTSRTRRPAAPACARARGRLRR